jgi:predicted nucleotidyltransferase
MPAMKREYNLNMAAVQTLASYNEIVAFCKRWKVVEFALFGSALRDDFSPESDVDALVSFAPDSNWGLFEHVQMRQELKSIFARDVDLITRRALEQSRNTLLRSEILSTAKVVFSEGGSVHDYASERYRLEGYPQRGTARGYFYRWLRQKYLQRRKVFFGNLPNRISYESRKNGDRPFNKSICYQWF